MQPQSKFRKTDVAISERNRDPATVNGAGYAASGESEYSRAMAFGGRNLRDGGEVRRIGPNTHPDEKVRIMQIQIGKVEGRLIFERDPVVRAKLEKQLRIKKALLVEYGRERNDTNYVQQKVSV